MCFVVVVNLSLHICAWQSVAQKEDWGALTLMDLLWSVLKHGNLSLLNCTDGGRSSRRSRSSRSSSSCSGHSGRTTLSHCTLAKCSITIMGRNIKGRNYQPSASTPTLLLSSSPAIDWTLLELTGLGQTVESSCTILLLKRGFSMDGKYC